MNILKSFASLLSLFDRSRISEDIDQLRSEIKDNLLPEYTKAAALVGNRQWQAPSAKAFNDLFGYDFPAHRRDGFLKGIEKIFVSMPEKLAVVEDLVGSFSKDVAKDALTYRQASVIRWLEIARFATTYAVRSLIRQLGNESAAVLGKTGDFDKGLTAAELAWFKANEQAFFQALKVIDVSPDQLGQSLASIPDVTIVGDKVGQVKATLGEAAIDPLKMGLISATKNPIYHVRMAIAEWQVRRFKAKEEEKKQLQFRILELKEAYANKQDPKLQQAIEYSQGRLQKLTYELQEMQEDLA